MDYIYWLSYTPEDKELAFLEASFLFDQKVNSKVVYSKEPHNIENAAYVKLGGELLQTDSSFNELCAKIEQASYDFTDFKIEIHKSALVKKEVGTRLSGVIVIANLLKKGKPDLINPSIELDIFSDETSFYFLKRLSVTNNSWLHHINKPHNFSSSLNARHCRALANIASFFGNKILDPCCGFGNLLIEAHAIGLKCLGVEINPKHVYYAKKNLAYFQINPDLVIEADILTYQIDRDFDCAVIDFPYNLNCKTSDDFYLKTLTHLKKKIPHFVILTAEPIDDLLKTLNIKIWQQAKPFKNSFVRIVTVCSA